MNLATILFIKIHSVFENNTSRVKYDRKQNFTRFFTKDYVFKDILMKLEREEREREKG